MIRAFAHENGQLAQLEGPAVPDAAIWVDLALPDAQEIALVAQQVGVPLPSRADMEEIELSSRLYHDHGADYLTVMVPGAIETDHATVAPVTFVVTPGRIITLRHHAPRPFDTFPAHAGKTTFGCAGSDAVLLGLFEEIIDRIADILELISGELEQLSRRVFDGDATGAGGPGALQSTLAAIGRKGDLVGDIRLSLLTLERALAYLGPTLARRDSPAAIVMALDIGARDIRSLNEHSGFLSQKASLMLEATLGMINIEQNATIKIFSVVAVVFMPPTLIASIYGMNFGRMPELGWNFGYPLALVAMAVSAVMPYFYFKRRGWL
ncbi:MAG: magnesium transporter [Confluentimicrobium sp.]|jgi:magnesium transporter|uniref:magnesium transporter CorA family protein n=1 Tax=Actibacterium sp. TaxID=1872125 RepID=UPI000C69F03D|nr:magnesium transporter CorA family protein [Actibacterium sp.]MBC57982.1 magnesium transporter [Actibacterium sp.]|tara:strand:- start:310 stop:1278 length:969 start_codon:yes stop_codon:yes gene_type:complete